MEYTNRIQHIDVMKGILIIMVVAGHVCYALSTYSKIQLTNSAYSVYCDFINSFVAPYYMAAFFLTSSMRHPVSFSTVS